MCVSATVSFTASAALAGVGVLALRAVRTPGDAKLAGAPHSPRTRIDCRARIGDILRVGDPPFHVYAQTLGELHYALEYAASQPDVFRIGGAT